MTPTRYPQRLYWIARRLTLIPRRSLWILLVVLAAACLIGSDRARPPSALAAPGDTTADPPLGGLSYRLAETWADEPWRPEAGRFGQVADISSPPADPSGPIYVLDSRQRVVHVLDPNGQPRTVFAIRSFEAVDEPWTVQRLDVGFDGTLYVLSASLRPTPDLRYYRVRIDRLAPDGRRLAQIELRSIGPYAFRDLAIRSDGRIYLSRVFTAAGGAGPGGTPLPTPDAGGPLRAVDVLDPAGHLVASLSPPALVFPDSLDIAADGTLYVVNRIPANFGGPGPAATPTARPSWRGATGQAREGGGDRAPVNGPDQAPGSAIEGVMVFEPDHAYRETLPFFDAEDLAVGPAGVFVARDIEVFALGEARPMYVGPVAYQASASSAIFHLDVPADGRVLVGMAHCYTQGVVMIDAPAARPASGRLVAGLDQPELEGPVYPLRVAASDGVAVLQGRYDSDRGGSATVHHVRSFLHSGQTVQRWTRTGLPVARTRLESQLGLCSGLDGWSAQDVAIDGHDVYTVDPGTLQRRPDDLLPAWSVLPLALAEDPDAPTFLAAVSADAGRVAALDSGAGTVLVLDRAGTLIHRWSVSPGPAGGESNTLPVDLALAGGAGRVYLADQGRSRIEVRGLDGAQLGAWPAHDGPRALAVGPSGDVFVLGRGGWAFRYRPDGRLLATWRVPDPTAEALDIAVDVDERVYINFVRTHVVTEAQPPLWSPVSLIDAAGLWVFEAAPVPAAPPPAAGACVARPDKTAAPQRIPLGASVEVALKVAGRCPGQHEAAQIAVVFDSSRSMAQAASLGGTIERARAAALAFVGGVDTRTTELALVTFGDGAVLAEPLGRNPGAVAGDIAALVPDGDTQLAAGLAVALAELTGPRGDAGARRSVLLVTDGAFKDDPLPMAQAIRAAGIAIHALVYPNDELTGEHRSGLEGMVASPDRLHWGLDPRQAAALVDPMLGARPEDGLFETITIEDLLPANMRYVPDSAIPPASYDAARRRLTWQLAGIAAADGVALRFRVVPQQVGLWPTNVEASADYRDALGKPGRLLFPIPEVEVVAPAARIYLPLAAARLCFQAARPLDVALVIDASSSMDEVEGGAGGRTKLQAAQAAAGVFVDLVHFPPDRVADRIAVVAFSQRATRVAGLTGDRAQVHAALAGLATAPGTRIDLGLAEAAGVLDDGRRPGAQPVVILLTDGLQNQAEAPNAAVLAQGDGLKAGGAIVYTIGLGGEIDHDLLRGVATSPDRYYESPIAAELEAIYRAISARLLCEVQ